MRRLWTRLLLVSLALWLTTACDFVVEDGEVLELDNRLVARGSAGDDTVAPLPAVTVRPGGTLIVRDADVFGGDRTGAQLPPATRIQPPAAAPGVRVDGGLVFVERGRLEGGAILVPESATVPSSNPGAASFAPTLGQGGAAIDARSAVVSITGGGFFGGAGRILVSSTGILSGPIGLPGDALVIDQSSVMISGGGFVGGPTDRANPQLLASAGSQSARIQRSNVLISGGTFFQTVGIAASQSSILGGSFTTLLLGAANLPGAGCTEIRGGRFRTLVAQGSDTVYLFGSGFSLPLGPVSFPEPGFFNPFAPAGSGTTGSVPITGTLADGTALLASLISVRTSMDDPDAAVILAAPGDPGCPMGTPGTPVPIDP